MVSCRVEMLLLRTSAEAACSFHTSVGTAKSWESDWTWPALLVPRVTVS